MPDQAASAPPDTPAATALRVVEIAGKVNRLVADVAALTSRVDAVLPAINDIGHYAKALDRAFETINVNALEAQHKEEKHDHRWDVHLAEYKGYVSFANKVMGGIAVILFLVGAVTSFAISASNFAAAARAEIVAAHTRDQAANISRFEVNETKIAETAVLVHELKRQAP